MKQAFIIWTTLGIGVALGRLQVKTPVVHNYSYDTGIVLPDPQSEAIRSKVREQYADRDPNDIRLKARGD